MAGLAKFLLGIFQNSIAYWWLTFSYIQLSYYSKKIFTVYLYSRSLKDIPYVNIQDLLTAISFIGAISTFIITIAFLTGRNASTITTTKSVSRTSWWSCRKIFPLFQYDKISTIKGEVIWPSETYTGGLIIQPFSFRPLSIFIYLFIVYF